LKVQLDKKLYENYFRVDDLGFVIVAGN